MWSPRDHVAIPDPAARVSTAVVIPLAQEVAAQKTADSDDLVISENQLGPAGQSAVTSSVSASLYCEICPQTALRPYPFMSGHDTSRTRPPSCRIDFDSGRAGCRELLDESSARCPRINTHQVVWKSSYHASPLAERALPMNSRPLSSSSHRTLQAPSQAKPWSLRRPQHLITVRLANFAPNFKALVAQGSVAVDAVKK